MKRPTLSKETREALHCLRGALVFAGIGLAVGISLYLGGLEFRRGHEQALGVAQQRLADARQVHQQTVTEQESIRNYLLPYNALHDQIDRERRLDWIEALSNIRTARKLFPAEYDIAPQRPYTFPGLPMASALKLRASRMNLKLPLLHENDLFMLFDGLRARRVGLFVVEYCDITRSTVASAVRFDRNLTAECAVDWITLEGGEVK